MPKLVSADTIRQYLVDHMEEHCRRFDMSLTHLGKLVMNDSHIAHDIVDGKNITLGTYDKFIKWMEEHSEDGAYEYMKKKRPV